MQMIKGLELLKRLHKEGLIDFAPLDSMTYFEETKVYVIKDRYLSRFAYVIINEYGDVIAMSDGQKLEDKDNE